VSFQTVAAQVLIGGTHDLLISGTCSKAVVRRLFGIGRLLTSIRDTRAW
jgi:hypothetical protein